MSKVAIITGASRGMGAAIAAELSQRNYQLVLMSPSGAVDVAKKLSAVGLQGSTTNPEDLQRAVDTALQKFGRIDAVVNSTGHAPKGDLLSLTDQQWHDAMDLLLLNAVRMARLVTPTMLKQGSGAIVNISTFAALEPSADFPLSSCLRAGLASFTKLFADQYASHNIRMNNVLPGFIDSYSIEDSVRAKIPMQRSGTVTEIAKTAAFLLSEDAGYITGQNIRVDGGLTRHV